MQELELKDAVDKILRNQQLIVQKLIVATAAAKFEKDGVEKIVHLMDRYLDEMGDYIYESYKTLRALKIEMGIAVDDDDLEGLTAEEILNSGVGEMADCYGMHSAHIKFMIESMKLATGKYPGEIVVRDIIATPHHYFLDYKTANKGKIKKVMEFIQWVKERIDERQEAIQ